MAIIVETGVVVTGANSFASLASFTTYCEERGRDISTYDEDTLVLPALIKMGDYLNSLNWKGLKTARANPMCWPRYGESLSGWNEITQPASMWVGVVDSDGYIIGVAEVPSEVVQAQNEGAWLILTGKDMEPSLDRGGQLKKEKYDVVEFEYFSGASPTTEFTAVSNRLRGLLKSSTCIDIERS